MFGFADWHNAERVADIAVNSPPPLLLAQELAPLLLGLNWGIGGSLLLYHLKLETDPQDLDIVTTPEDFPEIHKRLAAFLGSPIPVDHPTYASMHFSRFASPHGVNLDVMARHPRTHQRRIQILAIQSVHSFGDGWIAVDATASVA